MRSRKHLAILAAAVVVLSSTVRGTAQDGCSTTTLREAERAYTFGLVSQSYAILNPCLPDGFREKDERADAYRLMALSHIAADSLDRARQSVRMLLKTDSRFRPDPDTDSPLFVNLVNDQKPAWYTFIWRGNSLGRWVGRAVVVGAAVAIPLALQPAPQEPDLPGPPGFPN